MLYSVNGVVKWKHVVAVSTENLRKGVRGGPFFVDNENAHQACIIRQFWLIKSRKKNTLQRGKKNNA